MSTFAGAEVGSTNAFGSSSYFQIDYRDLDQDGRYNDIVLTSVIPEPSAWLLVLAGLGLLAMVRRRSS